MDQTLTNYVYNYVKENYEDTLHAPTKYLESTEFVERELLSRAVYLGRTVGVAVTASVDIIIGVVATALTMLTLGMNKDCSYAMHTYLVQTKAIVAAPIFGLVQTLHPKAALTSDSSYENVLVPLAETGITVKYAEDLLTKVEVLKDSDNAIVKHVISRLCIALTSIAYVVTRAVDVVIGAIATLFMFITLGNFESLNNLAIRGLQGTGIVGDIACLAVLIINPFTEFHDGG